MTDFAYARKTMVDNQLKVGAITDRRLLAAMGDVPREKFVPATRRLLAYIDEAQPLNATRQLAAPAPFAGLVQLAAVEHADRVLDVGCGTGYSAAVLGRLAAEVIAIEDDVGLATIARKTLSELGVANVTVVERPLDDVAIAGGPFDVIVLEGTVPQVPAALLDRLKPQGRLVASIGAAGKVPVAHIFVRSGQGVAARADFDARLPPLAKTPDESFVF